MALLVAAVLAGCSDPPEALPCSDPSRALDADCVQPPEEVQASETTGIIRGVVIDQAIKPVADVQVTVPVTGGAPLSAKTAANGAFAFEGLAPGTYFVRAQKEGFVAGQTSVSVEAGVDDPPMTKIQLTTDFAALPYFAEYKFDGYIECSFSLLVAGLAACDTVPNLNDQFITEYALDRIPTWTQSEMVWESTQPVSDEMNFVYSYAGDDAFLTNYVDVHGPSPVVGYADQALATQVGLGKNITLMIRVFNEPVEGTQPPDPVNGDECVDRPALGGCMTGVGATVEQSFTVFTHVFYGYAPPSGWTFGAGGEVPAPA